MKNTQNSQMSANTALLFFYSLGSVAIWLEYLSLMQPLLSILALGVLISPIILIAKHEVDLTFVNIAHSSRYFLALIPLAIIFAMAAFYFASYEKYISSTISIIIAISILPFFFKHLKPRPFRYAIRRHEVKVKLSNKVKQKNSELNEKIEIEKKKFYAIKEKKKETLEDEIRVKREVESMKMSFEQEKLKIKLAKIEQQMVDSYKIDEAVANLIENELGNIDSAKLPEEAKEELISKVQKDFDL